MWINSSRRSRRPRRTRSSSRGATQSWNGGYALLLGSPCGQGRVMRVHAPGMIMFQRASFVSLPADSSTERCTAPRTHCCSWRGSPHRRLLHVGCETGLSLRISTRPSIQHSSSSDGLTSHSTTPAASAKTCSPTNRAIGHASSPSISRPLLRPRAWSSARCGWPAPAA